MRMLHRLLGITNASTVFSIRQCKGTHRSYCAEITFQHIRAIRTSDRLRLRLAEIHFDIKHEKRSYNEHADTLSELLTGSPTVANDDDSIPAFQLADENDLDIFSSTINNILLFASRTRYSHRTRKNYWNHNMNDDHVLVACDVREDEPHLDKLTLEELTPAQYCHRFCSDICRLLKESILSFAQHYNGLLVRTVNTDRHIIIPHSLEQIVLALRH